MAKGWEGRGGNDTKGVKGCRIWGNTRVEREENEGEDKGGEQFCEGRGKMDEREEETLMTKDFRIRVLEEGKSEEDAGQDRDEVMGDEMKGEGRRYWIRKLEGR